jgi:glycopeptide antibiotics resistance protein
MQKKHTFRIISFLFSLFYFSLLSYAVFFARRRRHIDRRDLNLIPAKNMIAQYRQMADMGAFNYYANLLGNVILFLPIPYIMIKVFRMKKFSSILLTGLLISFAIELIQYVFEVGVADIDDIILNTLGTCIGFVCYKILEKFYYHTNSLSV